MEFKQKIDHISSLKPAFAALLLLTWTLTIQVQCQDEIRALSEKNEGSSNNLIRSGTSTRAVSFTPRSAYGHHQIMHFGKRPSYALPSSVYQYLMEQQQQQQTNKFPASWTINRGQPLEPLEEEVTAFEFPDPIPQNRMPIYSIIGQPDIVEPNVYSNNFNSNPYIARFLQATSNGSPTKFSRLVSGTDQFSADPQESNENSDSNNKSSAGAEQNVINVATRSPHSPGSQRMSNPMASGGKNYISTLLYGRSSTPSLASNSFGSFIKKAEAKDNVFMHFGRK